MTERLGLNGEWLKWIVVALIGGAGGGGTSLLRGGGPTQQEIDQRARLVAKAEAADLLVLVNKTNTELVANVVSQIAKMNGEIMAAIDKRLTENAVRLDRLQEKSTEKAERLATVEAIQGQMVLSLAEIRQSTNKILGVVGQRPAGQKGGP
jgi:hypothetical protein